MKVDYYPPILPGQYHHCVNHAVGNELVFRQIDNYYYFKIQTAPRTYYYHLRFLTDA